MPVELLEEDREFAINIMDLHDLEETGFLHVELARQGRQIDWAHVEDLKNSDHSKWDAILITKTSIGYVLLGGYHRREAAKKKKPQVATLNAICKTFKAERDVINAVFEDNATHGLKPSTQTKSDHAYFLWVAYPGITHKEIALKVGISRSGVTHAIDRKAAKALEKAEEKTERTAGEAEGVPDITDLPKKESAGAVTEKARQEKGIAPVIKPGTQPDEEKQRQEIVKASNALSDDTQRLLEYLQKVGEDKLRAAGITSTLEAVHKRLEEGIHIIDEVLHRPQEEIPDQQEAPEEQ